MARFPVTCSVVPSLSFAASSGAPPPPGSASELDPAARLAHGPSEDKDVWRDLVADRPPSKTAAPLRAAMVLGEGSEALEDRCVVAIVGEEEKVLAVGWPSRSREEDDEEEEDGSSADLLLRGGDDADADDDVDDTEDEECVC